MPLTVYHTSLATAWLTRSHQPCIIPSEAVNAVFVSGFEIYPRKVFARFAPYTVWTENRVNKLMADGRYRSPTCGLGNMHFGLCCQIVPPMVATTWPSPWPAPTLIVAAGKGSIIPSMDHHHDAVKLWNIGRELNSETVAVTHPGMRHPWNRQDPRLFAETASTWLEGEDIHGGLERRDSGVYVTDI